MLTAGILLYSPATSQWGIEKICKKSKPRSGKPNGASSFAAIATLRYTFSTSLRKRSLRRSSSSQSPCASAYAISSARTPRLCRLSQIWRCLYTQKGRPLGRPSQPPAIGDKPNCGESHKVNYTDDVNDDFHTTFARLGRSLNTLNISSLSGNTITQAVRKISMQSVQSPMCF